MTVQDFQLRIAYKNPCRLATTANHALSGLAAIDGVVPLTGERILVKEQTTPSENGVYLAAGGAWSRARDFDSNALDDQVVAGSAFYIQEGSTLAKKTFVLTTTGSITVGSTSLTFEGGTTAGGSVTGPASSTDHALARWDGATGTLILDSGVTLDDNANLAGAASLTMAEQGTAPNPSAGEGAFWVRDDVLSAPVYTDDGNNTYHLLNYNPLKRPVDLATTGNITLSGEQTIDGTLTSSSRVLVKSQSTASQNGIYTSGVGAWTRTADWDNGDDDHLDAGVIIYVQGGSENAGKTFKLDTAAPITVGTTGVAFSNYTPTVGGLGGTTGSTDNRVLRADGTGGSTVQGSGVTLDDDDRLSGVQSVVMLEEATGPTVSTGEGGYWVRNLTPSAAAFTDDAGTDFLLPATPISVGDGRLAMFSGGSGGRQISAGVKMSTAGGNFLPDTDDAQDLGSQSPANAWRVGYLTRALYMKERASASADIAAWGQWWTRDDTPNVPVFTDDTGTDINLRDYSPAKRPVRVATVGNVNLTAGSSPDAVDGVTLSVGDRILVRSQTTGSENGLYEMTVDGGGTDDNTWARTSDFDNAADDHIEAGMMVYVQEGDSFSRTVHYLVSPVGTITIGSSTLVFISGRPLVRSDSSATTDGGINGDDPTETQATAIFSDEYLVNDYDDVDVVIDLGGTVTSITDLTVFAEIVLTDGDSEWAVLQSDDAISGGAVTLGDYLPLQQTPAAGRYHWNFPSRGAKMRFGVFCNTGGNGTGATVQAYVKRNVRA